ncbi:MAG: hypothetical protein Q9216_002498, partial [Gyalolechia sp. 2 TL-2023]
GALLTDITKGAKLKKAVTNDRSAPQVGKASGSSSGPLVGAPPVPGMPNPPAGLVPPVPGGQGVNRGRSSSDTSGGGDTNTVPSAPPLGGIFAGVGMPKLKKTGGGVDTGASRDSSYASDPETSRPSAPKTPSSFAPKPPTAPKINALRPKPQTSESSPPQPANPLVANLRKPPPKPLQRPSSSADVVPPRAPPPLPGSSRPPPPPVTLRKPSTALPPPLQLPSVTPTPPSAPPPPPSIARVQSSAAPAPVSAASPPSATPRPPPARTYPSSQSFGTESQQSLAMQAARNAFGNGPPSPAAPPPTPPISTSSASRPSGPSPPPAPPAVPPPSQPSVRLRGNSNLSTLPNGTGSSHHTPNSVDNFSYSKSNTIKIEDPRWRFQDESQLPKPREFIGFAKRYRAGRGSSVPLDLSQFP